MTGLSAVPAQIMKVEVVGPHRGALATSDWQPLSSACPRAIANAFAYNSY
jgi:hypothetical protein